MHRIRVLVTIPVHVWTEITITRFVKSLCVMFNGKKSLLQDFYVTIRMFHGLLAAAHAGQQLGHSHVPQQRELAHVRPTGSVSQAAPLSYNTTPEANHVNALAPNPDTFL